MGVRGVGGVMSQWKIYEDWCRDHGVEPEPDPLWAILLAWGMSLAIAGVLVAALVHDLGGPAWTLALSWGLFCLVAAATAAMFIYDAVVDP